MTTAKLFQQMRTGEVSKARFLAEVRKDSKLPWITNMTSYEDAIKILKNKGIVSENILVLDPNPKPEFPEEFETAGSAEDVVDQLSEAGGFTQALTQHGMGNIEKAGAAYDDNAELDENRALDVAKKLKDEGMDEDAIYVYLVDDMGLNNMSAQSIIDQLFDSNIDEQKEALNEADNNIQMIPEVDLVNPYFLKRGMQVELSKIKQLTDDSYVIAMNKAAKKLHKNPHAYDDVMLFNAKQIEKRDAKLEMDVVKKDNHVDKDNEMKRVKGFEAKKNTSTPKTENKKGKPKGVKTMKEDNKEKVLHEIANFLKKKDNLSENGGPVTGLIPQERSDFHKDAEVMTPEGLGKVVQRRGSIVELEMEDGSTKHFTLNVLDKSQDDHQQKQADAAKAERDKMWSDWDKRGEKTFGGMTVDPKSSTQDLLKKLKGLLEKLKMKKEGGIVMTKTGTAVAGTKNPADAFKKALDLRQQTGDQFDVVDTRTGQKKKV